MTRLLADLISLAQPQQRAMPCARWKAQRRISKPPPSLCGRVEQTGQQAQRLEIDARSCAPFKNCQKSGFSLLSCVEVTAAFVTKNCAKLRAVASRKRCRLVRRHEIALFDRANMNVVRAGNQGVYLAGCHLVSPVDVSNIAHHALINNTVRRNIFRAYTAQGELL